MVKSLPPPRSGATMVPTWKRKTRTRGGNMAKPKIRHLAILARNPKKMADYYIKVFDMELIHKNPQGTAFFLSDGYITMAVLPHKLENDGSVGLNHFGFQVDDVAALSKKIVAFDIEE